MPERLPPHLRKLQEKIDAEGTEPSPVPLPSSNGNGKPHEVLGPMCCESWSTLIEAWRRPLKMRQELKDILAVMLAVALSTERQGEDQLFLMVIGSPGSAKSRFCDAMLVSDTCYPLEHLKGFHSGWKDPSGEDYSLLARINRKTWITSEGDVLMSSPQCQEIMSQQRRIFDGTSGASYKNKKQDSRYVGLRTPWIMAGTPSLLSYNQATLGDRFLRVWIDPPDEDEQDAILDRAIYSAIRSVKKKATHELGTHMDPNMALAYQMTGGYVTWLRANAETLLNRWNEAEGMDDTKEEEAYRKINHHCKTLSKFVAALRARPHSELKKDLENTVEQPNRLGKQFGRLCLCVAAVLGVRPTDPEVFRIVRKVAIDTSRGRMFRIIRAVYKGQNAKGKPLSTTGWIGAETGHGSVNDGKDLRFLQSIGVVKSDKVPSAGVIWRLTPRFRGLWEEVMYAR